MTDETKTAETITAIATATGRGSIGVIRVSGPCCQTIAKTILGYCPAPRRADLCDFVGPQGELLDRGIALYFPAPHSYTGEDVLELQGHGGTMVLDLLLAMVLETGARMARPGEFTERAYLNNKMDLAQAEAVADLIDSATHGAARSATRSLTGEFSNHCYALSQQAQQLQVHVEAAINFPDDEVDFLADQQISNQLTQINQRLRSIHGQAQQGQLLRDGLTIVLLGAPNAGKSSLLNALVEQDRAIVSAIAGTTRDTLTETIQLEGVPLHIVDTAGLREASNEIEAEGIRRARHASQAADLALIVIDSNEPGDWQSLINGLPRDLVVICCWNKSDLAQPSASERDSGALSQVSSQLVLSARTGSGLAPLRGAILQHAGRQPEEASVFSARRRHLKALTQAEQHGQQAEQHLRDGHGELVAEELRLLQQSLGEITGEVSDEALLGLIFSSFCIGK